MTMHGGLCMFVPVWEKMVLYSLHTYDQKCSESSDPDHVYITYVCSDPDHVYITYVYITSQ